MANKTQSLTLRKDFQSSVVTDNMIYIIGDGQYLQQCAPEEQGTSNKEVSEFRFTE